jgi:hypothetical protein
MAIVPMWLDEGREYDKTGVGLRRIPINELKFKMTSWSP